MKVNSNRALAYLLFSVVALYVAPYLLLSRWGYREADKYNWHGFYFVVPETQITSAMNHACRRMFFPLVQCELLLGTGRGCANDPMRVGSGVSSTQGDSITWSLLASAIELAGMYLPGGIVASLVWLTIYWRSIGNGRVTLSGLFVLIMLWATALWLGRYTATM